MVQITELQKIFDQKLVLEIEHLTINTNEAWGLVGNNGAGKTTLFRAILDLIKLNRGNVTINGQGVATSENWKQITGSYLDDSFLVPYLTPEEHFEFVASAYNISQETLNTRLNLFKDFFSDEILGQKKYIRTFSQGNKRKIGIASAILASPKILILDEPFANLDPRSQYHLVRLLNDMKEERNTTILISSHDLNHITSICDRIVLLEKGKVIQDIEVDISTLKVLESYFSLDKYA
jgi:ABC-2 type transport system ATP-binding protein